MVDPDAIPSGTMLRRVPECPRKLRSADRNDPTATVGAPGTTGELRIVPQRHPLKANARGLVHDGVCLFEKREPPVRQSSLW